MKKIVLMSFLFCGFYFVSSCTQPNNPESVAEKTSDGSTTQEQEPKSFTKLSADGYTTVSDVTIHNKVGADINDINVLLAKSPIDWAAVKALYVNGKHSVKSDGSIRSLNGFASSGNNFIEFSPTAATYFEKSGSCQQFPDASIPCTAGKFVDELVESLAIDGKGPQSLSTSEKARSKVISNGLLVLMSYWIRLEMGKAIGKAKEGNFDAAEGAPHNWDEGFAFFWGPNGRFSLYEWAQTLSIAYKLERAVQADIMAGLVSGLATMTSEKKEPSLSANAVVKQFHRLFLLGLLDAAQKMEQASTDADKKAEKWGGYALWLGVGDLITKDSALETVVKEIFVQENLTTEPSKKLKTALNAALTNLGFVAKDFGIAFE